MCVDEAARVFRYIRRLGDHMATSIAAGLAQLLAYQPLVQVIAQVLVAAYAFDDGCLSILGKEVVRKVKGLGHAARELRAGGLASVVT